MKIISKFRDYYDGLACSMRDDLVFIREQKTVKIEGKQSFSLIEYIGFCGNVYPCYQYGEHYYFQKDEALNYYVANVSDLLWKRLYTREFNHDWDNKPSYDGLIWHQKSLIHGNLQITYNCNLYLLQFMKVKDIYSTYQELAQYLSNQANPEKPLPILDDKTMRDIKGFDKFSFKKEKK